jgi:hypothetical protein
MPDSRDLDTAAHAATDPTELVRRLNEINAILIRARNRLTEIADGYQPPPIGDRPPVLAALAHIRGNAGAVDTIAADLIARTPPG